jgi:hypothetical protein
VKRAPSLEYADGLQSFYEPSRVATDAESS